MPIFVLCRSLTPEELKEIERHGPHSRPAIKVYANPLAYEALQSDSTSPMPVGSVVIKEKLWTEDAPKAIAYAAMIKHEPGYDPEHGDWEYAFVERADESGKLLAVPAVTRGKLQECIGCHQAAAATDYLYRQYKEK